MVHLLIAILLCPVRMYMHVSILSFYAIVHCNVVETVRLATVAAWSGSRYVYGQDYYSIHALMIEG